MQQENWPFNQQQLATAGYTIINNVFTTDEIFTIRIHLDDTDENNGALKVIPGSHLKGVYRPETIGWERESMVTCSVKKGGVMIMRPLLLHASERATGNNNRRVIHIEFANTGLPEGLQWAASFNHTR